MAEYSYVATAVDSKNPTRSGLLSATNRQEAEKQVKALFAYPVTVSLKEFAFVGSEEIEKLIDSQDVKAAPVAVSANTPSKT
ncbi:hypothetical protein [Pseudomonas sp. zfem002]|uniref:hypothetical protein n=1 Tax=Pseudomonas sp. zfem002 TaxID=3078197 RepID=UPI0029297BD9|nr:hypothetical protein [Pseudomonas sp. zfem002]MDU9390011.1 hypothetical protein [Pseudomonas sp. zfem002]